MPRWWVILIAFCLLLAGCASKPPLYAGRTDHVRAAQESWREGDLDGAVRHLESALDADPDDADAHAWMAEALRRREKYRAAASHARRALSLDPDHAFAMGVLGDLYNPQFRGDPSLQDMDDSIRMYRAALAADPYDPEGLVGLCTWTIRKGDPETTSACLRAMDASGLWSESIVALAMWMLESAPHRAILLLNGDADAFPIWMLQDRGIRTDVLTCHLSLLNLEDYRDTLSEAGLPLPEGSLYHTRSPEGDLVRISKQVIEHLLDLNRNGSLGRPLAIAITVDSANLPRDTISDSYLRGGVWVPGPAAEITEVDIEATRPLMAYVPPKVVSGTWITPRERSIVRLRGGEALRYNPMSVAVSAFRAALRIEDLELAAWYRDLYLAYRKELGAFPGGDEVFEKVDAAYNKFRR